MNISQEAWLSITSILLRPRTVGRCLTLGWGGHPKYHRSNDPCQWSLVGSQWRKLHRRPRPPKNCAFHVGSAGSQHFPTILFGKWDGVSFRQPSCGYFFSRQPQSAAWDSQQKPGVQTYTKMGYFCADWGCWLSWLSWAGMWGVNNGIRCFPHQTCW